LKLARLQFAVELVQLVVGLEALALEGDGEVVLCELLELFVRQSPVTVMMRATLENVLSDERLDALFLETAERQRPSDVLFSLLVDLMGSVVCNVRPSIHAAIQARQDEIDVSMRAIYGKLQGVETCVSRALVRDTAQRMGAIIEASGGGLAPWVKGYRVKILDGNHLPHSERRLGVLRPLNVAPLPGHTLVVLDPAWMLAIDAFPCEDAQPQERGQLPQVLETVEPGDLWIADRAFATRAFLAGIAQRGAFFVIRQHGSLKGQPLSPSKKLGRTETGVVYEQALDLGPDLAEPIRRVTVQLDREARNGESEIHVLTNLPGKITAKKVAELYRQRWTVETAFQELEAALSSELATLAYPEAALFGFCTALVAYNLLGVVKAALRAAHGTEIQEEVSGYYLADEVAGTWRGMMIVLPADLWRERFGALSARQIAAFLVQTAKHVQLSRFKKHPRGPKRPPPAMKQHLRNGASTAKILRQAKLKKQTNR
jgi:IS4 transposase